MCLQKYTYGINFYYVMWKDNFIRQQKVSETEGRIALSECVAFCVTAGPKCTTSAARMMTGTYKNDFGGVAEVGHMRKHDCALYLIAMNTDKRVYTRNH